MDKEERKGTASVHQRKATKLRTHQSCNTPSGVTQPLLKKSFLMRFRRRWYEIKWKTLCCSADTQFVRLRLSRYSIISFSSATAKGPRRTHAASSGLPSLADSVTRRRGRNAGTHHGHVEGAACNMRARTMLCINPNSASSLMLKSSFCCTRHLSFARRRDLAHLPHARAFLPRRACSVI